MQYVIYFPQLMIKIVRYNCAKINLFEKHNQSSSHIEWISHLFVFNVHSSLWVKEVDFHKLNKYALIIQHFPLKSVCKKMTELTTIKEATRWISVSKSSMIGFKTISPAPFHSLPASSPGTCYIFRRTRPFHASLFLSILNSVLRISSFWLLSSHHLVWKSVDYFLKHKSNKILSVAFLASQNQHLLCCNIYTLIYFIIIAFILYCNNTSHPSFSHETGHFRIQTTEHPFCHSISNGLHTVCSQQWFLNEGMNFLLIRH